MHEVTPQRNVLVTGASSGIGRACALLLGRSGFRVFASVRRQQDADALVAEAPVIRPIIMDVTSEESVAAMAKFLIEDAGLLELHGLVNNAGIAMSGPIECLEIRDFRYQLETNVIGQLAVIQAVAPLLRAGRGRVVNVSSICGRVVHPFLGAYAASKYALEALTDALRLEFHSSGIAVTAIEPGIVRTPLWDKLTLRLAQTREQGLNYGESQYDVPLAAATKWLERLVPYGVPPDAVARTILRVFNTHRPRTRYLVGMDARVQTVAARVLPTAVRDWLMRRMLGLQRMARQRTTGRLPK